jgi:hypothetical protein
MAEEPLPPTLCHLPSFLFPHPFVVPVSNFPLPHQPPGSCVPFLPHQRLNNMPTGLAAAWSM